MAGKSPSKEQIKIALGIYLANTPGIESVYDEPTDTYHLKDANGKEATIGPGWHCEDATLREAVGNILMDMLQGEPDRASAPKTAQKPAERVNVPAPQRSGQIPANGAMPRDSQISSLTTETIIQYICPKATEQEAYIFLQLCKARGLNPFLKEAYLIKYGDAPATMVVGKEHFTKTAENHTQFDGFEAGIILKTANGIERREGTFYEGDEELLGGWAKVWRKDRKMPFFNEARLKDFAKYTPSKKSPWDTMPAVMIRKIPLVQSLREAFPNDLAGCYDRAEMSKAIDAEYEVQG